MISKMLSSRSKRYRVLGFLQRHEPHLTRWVALAAAFLLGIVVNALSAPGSTEISTIMRVFDIGDRGIAAWLAWLCLVLVVVSYALRALVQLTTRLTSEAIRLTRLFEHRVEPQVRQFARGRIALGWQIVLQYCPKPQGWSVDDIDIAIDPTDYRFETAELEDTFARWLASHDADRVREGVSYRLMEDPAAFSDAPGLELRVQPNRFAAAAFFGRNIAIMTSERRRYLERTLRNDISYPNSLALHAVVATSDDWVLLTRRSAKVFYYPNDWSCSIEERLASADLSASGRDVMKKWVDRMLSEELGLGSAESASCSIRVLAVLIEADILNCALAALVTLSQTRTELDAILNSRPRLDYEFQDWRFIKWTSVAKEFVNPTLDYHPTSALRMFLAGVSKFGIFQFASQVEKAASSDEERRRDWSL